MVGGGFVIPIIFQTVENLQKELEIKVDLIEQMTESAMEPIGMVQVLEQNRSNYYPEIILSELVNETISKERLELMQEARLIESKLRSYFHDITNISRDWNNVAAPAYNFVNLYLVDSSSGRINVTRDIYRFFVNNATVIDLLSKRSEYETNDLLKYLNLNLSIPENRTKLEEFKNIFGEDLTAIEDLSKRTEFYNSSNPKDREKYRMAYDTVHDLIKGKFDRLSETILDRRIPEYKTIFSDLF